LTQERAAGDAHPMLNIASWERPLLEIWQADRPAIMAALVALAVLVLGRLVRMPLLQAAASGPPSCGGGADWSWRCWR
jgi:hypothetical protein